MATFGFLGGSQAVACKPLFFSPQAASQRRCAGERGETSPDAFGKFTSSNAMLPNDSGGRGAGGLGTGAYPTCPLIAAVRFLLSRRHAFSKVAQQQVMKITLQSHLLTATNPSIPCTAKGASAAVARRLASSDCPRSPPLFRQSAVPNVHVTRHGTRPNNYVHFYIHVL